VLLEVGSDHTRPVVGGDLAPQVLVRGGNTLGHRVFACDDGRVWLGAPGDGCLEVMIEASVIFVALLADDAVDDLVGAASDRAEEEALAVKTGAGLGDGTADGSAVAGVGGDAGGVDAVLDGEWLELVGETGLEATGAGEDKRTRGELRVRHSVSF